MRALSRGSFAAIAVASAAAPWPVRAAENYTMRLGIPSAADSVQGAVALRFASAVGHRTNGQLKIEVYPNGQLAPQQATVDALISGVIDLAIQSSAFLGPLIPRMQVFDVPFLYKDSNAGFRVLDGAVGNEFLAEMETKGIVGFGWGTAGMKELSSTTRAVVEPDDMKGMRVRIQNGAVFVALYQALGAIPIPIDQNETTGALMQHTVDAVDFNLDIVASSKLYSVLKHVAMMNHIFTVTPLMGSKRKVDALPAPIQKVLKEEGKAVIPFWRTAFAKVIDDDIALLKKNGVAFNEVKHPLFRKAMDPLYASLQTKLGGDLLERVGRIASA